MKMPEIKDTITEIRKTWISLAAEWTQLNEKRITELVDQKKRFKIKENIMENICESKQLRKHKWRPKVYVIWTWEKNGTEVIFAKITADSLPNLREDTEQHI